MEILQKLSKTRNQSQKSRLLKELVKNVSPADEHLIEPLLKECLKEKDDYYRKHFLTCFSTIGTPAIIDALIKISNKFNDFSENDKIIDILKSIDSRESILAIRDFALSRKKGISGPYSSILTPGNHQELKIRIALELLRKARKETNRKDLVEDLFYRLETYLKDKDLPESIFAEDILVALLTCLKRESGSYLPSYMLRGFYSLSQEYYYEEILAAFREIAKKHRKSETRKEAKEYYRRMLDNVIIAGKIFEISGSRSTYGEGYLRLEDVSPDITSFSEVKWGPSIAKIKFLRIINCRFASLDGLEKLTSLKRIKITKTPISDLSNLGKISELEDLVITDGDIKTLKGVKCPPKLDELELTNCNIIDLSGFIGSKSVKTLSLTKNQISVTHGIEGFPNLSFLKLDDNRISEINGFEAFTSLTYLSLCFNQITEIKGLDTLINLEKLYLSVNQISEIKGLEFLINLQDLWLAGNQISEIKGLEKLINLKELSIIDNNITEIKGLETLVNLQILRLSKNNIREIKGLESLTNLLQLELNNNQINELKGLEQNELLEKINLENNPLPKEIMDVKDGQTLVAASVGVPLVVDYVDKGSRVFPFVDAVLQYDVKNRCLYCRRSVSSNEQFNIDKCKKELEEIINKFIEDTPVGRVILKQETLVIYDSMHGGLAEKYVKRNVYMITEEMRREAKRNFMINVDYHGKIEEFYSFDRQYRSLAGTFCDKCCSKFLKSVKRNFKVNTSTRRSRSAINNDIAQVVNNHEVLVSEWIKKAKSNFE